MSELREGRVHHYNITMDEGSFIHDITLKTRRMVWGNVHMCQNDAWIGVQKQTSARKAAIFF